MGGFLFRRLFLFVLLVCGMVVFSVGVFSVVHPLYSGFSSPSSGFGFNNASGLISVSDTAVYKMGYYSVNGGAWQSFVLSGTSYNGDVNWLSSSSSYALPSLGVGEHYVIVYSCTYNQGVGSWDCHDNRWQLIVINNSGSSCGAVTCNSGYYCSNGACLLDVPGNTYFVAPWGNDNNPGTFEQPWGTWGKAFTSPSPGDIVYFRGGVYPMTVTNGNGYMSVNDGTSANPVYYWAYPLDFDSGNVPILDCENITPSGDLNHGIYSTADYVHFKGLTVRNVFQHDASDEAFGWRIGGINTTLELCTAYNVHGVGFRASASRNLTNLTFINCDAYNMIDYLDEAPLPGNDGYCFQVQNTQATEGGVYFYGCRAWNCSDDGFTLFSRSYIEIDNCWSFSNGALQGAGNGWKLGFLPDGGEYAPLTRKITNSIGAYSRASSITSNDNNNEAVTMQLYNNLAYRQGYSSGYSGISPGFYLYNTIYPDSEELKRVLKNNIGHANEDGPVRIAEGALYTHDHNSWDSSVVVTDDDFVLLPETPEQGFALLTAPRKADGSLPDLGEYFKLKQGSDLIDAGTIIPGYHCETTGAHPGDNCREWYGNAPDLGPFEYTGASQPTCSGSSTQSCSITNGAGTQSRTCVDGVWSSWGTCTLTSCNSCYIPSGNACVAATCSGSSTQSCSIANGVGSQSRTCSCGVWSSWGTCTLVSCNTGYTPSGNTCVAYTPPPEGSTFIVNHSHTNITAIPVSCINKVKSDLHIAYAHTSHGSQIYTGLQALEQYNSLYGIDANGANGELHFEDYYYNGFAISGACYDLSNCDNGAAGLLGPTRTFLNEPRGQDINVILWSWCAIGGHNIPFYLEKMQTIMDEYGDGNASHPLPVKFVFITGHAEFGGVGDPSDYANTIIRNFVNNQSANAFCKLNQCILFDFSDMENYDPDNNYYLDKRVEDGLQYDCVAPYNSGTKTCTWSIDYLAKYPNSLSANLVNNYISSCAHSPETGESPTSELNCALKGQAAWWMFARMVGWDGNPSNGC